MLEKKHGSCVVTASNTISQGQAEFIANFGGYHIMAIATVREVGEDGFIKKLTVRLK